MRGLSKYFTPPLSELEKIRLWNCLGLSDFPIVSVTCGDLSLREGLAGYELHYPGPQLPVREPHRPVGLWEELFHYPLRDLTARPEIAALKSAFGRLADAFADYEVALLGIKGRHAQTALLLHFVRRRCVRWGTSRELEETALKCWSSQAGPSFLQEFFGTRARFFGVDLASIPPLADPAEALTKAFLRALPLSPSPSPSPEIRL